MTNQFAPTAPSLLHDKGAQGQVKVWAIISIVEKMNLTKFEIRMTKSRTQSLEKCLQRNLKMCNR